MISIKVAIPESTIFSQKLKTFNSIQISHINNIEDFIKQNEVIVEKYKDSGKLSPQENRLDNSLNISCLLWSDFPDFKGESLKLIITIGKYKQLDGRYLLPVNVKFHHAVNDGYHASVFFNSIEENIKSFQNY